MAIFFPLFTLLEDWGLLPRIAFLLDHRFACCGACGKQGLTMCMGLGCNAVGVTGCRIIDSPRERLIAMLTNAFVKDSSGWCWVDGSGYIVYSQWVEDSGNKYYINAAGYRVTGEHTIDGESYYFDANGVMEIRYTVIFKNADGTVLSSKKYAAGATVQVPADPTKSPDANYTYTFAGWDKEIEVVTGDATYTATYTKTERPAGSQHGWVKENGKWYYYEQGVMVTNKWKKDSKGWCYLGADGAMVTNRWIKDSVGWCYVGGDGYCLTNSWVKDSTGWCYLDQNGRMAYNRWVGSGNTWYYIDGNGYMLANTSKVIDGKRYNFNASGLCTNP
jgi:glucan-binding YG repeat protein